MNPTSLKLRGARKLLWLAIPVILIAAYFGREKHAPAPGVPNTGTSSTQTVAVGEPGSSTPGITIRPTEVLQGDPAEIVVEGASSSVRSLTLAGKPLPVFSDNGRPAAVVGLRINASVGKYPVVAVLADGSTIKSNLVVGKRPVPTESLGIPASLGGNTPQAAENLVTQLSKDNAVLNSVPSVSVVLWQGRFQYPVADPVVTDTYGYSRSTVNTTISHEGLDFRAPPGTPVYAMNSGVVRIAQSFTAYGNTIVIDHGMGVQTLYMHLSELDVQPGESVTKGQVIGKSGETGYAEGPHLHLSIKIGGISIDPEKFLKLF